MNLDDLQTHWAEYDRKLDLSLRLNMRLVRESILQKADTSLRRLSLLIAIETAINFVAVAWLGSFAAEHFRSPELLIPAVILDVVAIVLLAVGIRQVIALRTIDYSEPVLAIQKRVETLRIERMRITKWILILAPLLWIPLLVVMVQGLFGVSFFEVLPIRWIATNVIFGLVVIPLMIFLSDRYADRMQRSPIVQRLMNDIAGRNLNAATAHLAELREFEG